MIRSTTKAVCVVKNICNEAGTLLFGFIVLITLIILYTINSPVLLLRFLINKATKLFRPDLISIVSPQGNLFTADLFSSKSPRCSIVVPVVIQGNFTEAEGYKRFTSMVNAKDKETGKDLYPEYKQYVENWLGFSFWKNDPHFDIRNHVKLYTSNSNDVTTQELRDLVEELLNKRFELGRSPWEVYILNNYDNGQESDLPKTALVMVFHHTLADGFSLLYSIIEGALNVPVSSIGLPTPTYANPLKHDKLSKLCFGLMFPIRLMHDLGQYFIKGNRKNQMFNVPDSQKAWYQVYGRGKPVPLQKIKEIKNALGVTFTSVLLGSIASCMSTIMKEKASRKREPIENERASFFIPLPMPGHPNALTNYVTGAQIDLPVSSFSDPTSRVRDCDMQLAKQKASTIPWLLQFLARTLGLHFSSVCGVLSANRVNIAGLTSFPVSPNELKLDIPDGKILSIEVATGALGGISGAGFMAMSYGKNMYFSVTAESSILTKRDVDSLLAGLCEEIDGLHEIASQKANL